MSVTVTITITPTGEAEVRTGATGADVTGEAPPPSLVEGVEGTTTAGAAEETAPRPLEPAQLGLGAAAEIGESALGPPPEDVAVAAEEAETSDVPPPKPIEDLE